MPKNNPFVRDVIRLDSPDFLQDVVEDGEPIFLIARQVVHAPGLVLRVGSRPLVIVADEYQANGGSIDGSGVPHDGPAGPGRNGVPDGTGDKNGHAGQDGAAGRDGASVTLVCRRPQDVVIRVPGGPGQAGGSGGQGGVGKNAIRGAHTGGGGGVHVIPVGDEDPGTQTSPDEDPPRRPVIHNGSTAGGYGGIGGRGGPGGAGGHITLYAQGDLSGAQLLASGGAGGAAGPAGAKGANGLGYVPPPPDPENGNEGEGENPPPRPDRSGAAGAEGSIDVQTLGDEAAFANALRQALGIYANHWAPYRIAMAEHHLRQFQPSAAEDNGAGRRAVAELEAALLLQPDNQQALRLHRHVVGAADGGGGGLNILGLPRDLDIRPLFDELAHTYESYAGLSLTLFQASVSEILTAEVLDALSQPITEQIKNSLGNEQGAADALRVSQAELDQAMKEVTYRQQQLDEINGQIKAALQEVHDQPLNLFGLFGTIGSIGAAVVGVIAAIPSAGASLVALAPSVVKLSESVLDHADDVTKAIFKHSEALPEDIKGQYEKVGKQAGDVIPLGHRVIDFVQLVDQLTSATTPDNARYLDLVKQGAIAAHDLLLAQRQVDLQKLRVDVGRTAVDRAAAVTQGLQALSTTLAMKEKPLVEAANFTLQVVQATLDTILGFAFQAQRAVEILTAQDASGLVDFTAGSLHPDDRRNYEEGRINNAQLLNLLQASWAKLLKPVELAKRLEAIRLSPDRDHRLVKLSLTDPAQLIALRLDHQLTLAIDLDKLVPGQRETKITNVALALLGARSRSGLIACEVTHGARYGQRLAGGAGDALTWQLLQARTTTVSAQLRPLSDNDSIGQADFMAGNAEQLAFWGRGLGGQLTLAIPEADRDSDAIDLGQLREIQLWIAYQFLRP